MPIGAQLSGLRLPLQHHQGFACLFDDFFADHALLYVITGRNLVHQIEHHTFENGAQTARPGLSNQRLAGYSGQRAIRKAQPHVFEFEQLLVLLDERVLGLREDIDQRVLVEFVQRGDHRQTANEFRNQPEVEQVL